MNEIGEERPSVEPKEPAESNRWNRVKSLFRRTEKPPPRPGRAKRLTAIAAATAVVLPLSGSSMRQDLHDNVTSPPKSEQVLPQKEFVTEDTIRTVAKLPYEELVPSLMTTEHPPTLSPDLVSELKVLRKKAPHHFLKIAPYLGNMPNLFEEIQLAADYAPDEIIEESELLKTMLTKEAYTDLLVTVFSKDPLIITPERKPLVKDAASKSKACETLLLLDELTTAVLLEPIVNDGLTEDEANVIVQDDNALFEKLVEIQGKPGGHLAEHAVSRELSRLSTNYVNGINGFHDFPDSVRFAMVENLSPEELYVIMAYTGNIIYTSSFNGLFDRMVSKMQGTSGSELIKKFDDTEKRNFIEQAANFNRLGEFLGKMTPEDKERLFTDTVADIEKADDSVKQASVVADIIATTSAPRELTLLQEQIINQHQRVKNNPYAGKEAVVLYGLLGSIIARKPGTPDGAVQQLAQAYPLPDTSTVKTAELFDAQGTNIQQIYFYNDKPPEGEAILDGHNSFKHMLNAYGFDAQWDAEGNIFSIPEAQNGAWKIEDKGKYVVIASTEGEHKVEMYANKPSYDIDGIKAIDKALLAAHKKVTVGVHRGHSTHLGNTIDMFQSDVKLAFLGACGGYTFLDQLNTSNVIATKGTGTMQVNDAMLKRLNELLLVGQDFTWKEYWDGLPEELREDEDFKAYVRPDENFGLVFLQAFRHLQQKTQQQHSPTDIPEALTRLPDTA